MVESRSRAILVTGFTPFSDQKVNASWEVAQHLPHEINGVRLIVRQIPVAYFESISIILDVLENNKDISDVILLGEAGGRSRISAEMIAVNYDDASIPDNNGLIRQGESIYEEGPDGLFSTISASKLVKFLTSEKAIPAYLSWSAGQFLCNHVLYGVLRHALIEKTGKRAIFIHLPYTSEQAVTSSVPGLPVEELSRGVRAVVEFVTTDPIF